MASEKLPQKLIENSLLAFDNIIYWTLYFLFYTNVDKQELFIYTNADKPVLLVVLLLFQSIS